MIGRRRRLARVVAAACAATAMPAAAGAVTLLNVTGGTVTVSLYDQNDTAVAVPCFEASIDNGQAHPYPGFPGICGSYAKLKVKAVGSKGLLVPGGTCWGENLPPGGTARITGTVDVCQVIVIAQP